MTLDSESTLATLVDRRLAPQARERMLTETADASRIALDSQQVLDVEKIANGTFSPLEGFLGQADYRSVCSTMRLVDGTPWSIPIILQVTQAEAAQCVPGNRVQLWNTSAKRPCAVLEIAEVYDIDLVQCARDVYGTEDQAHPGVRRLTEAGPHILSGPIWLLEESESLIPGGYDLEPKAVRAEIQRRGWKTVTGFQTRNLGHRAHEHLQKLGLELTDGLLVHPLIGWKKAGDMMPEVILEGYELLIDRYYPKERTLLAGLTTAMRYAGPREALFHAIIRRNFGCTHFIVGRDHAGVGDYYEKYAGHRIFDAFSTEELGIIPLRLHGPCYCKVCEQIVTEAICPHGPDGWIEISGTDVRSMVGKGIAPPKTIMRPEISELLIQRASEGRAFFKG